jgi:hypothetical protein
VHAGAGTESLWMTSGVRLAQSRYTLPAANVGGDLTRRNWDPGLRMWPLMAAALASMLGACALAN